MNRRAFLQVTAGAVLAAPVANRLLALPPREKAPFRVLYSNDTTNITSCLSPFHKAREPFRPEMLEATVDEVADTGVEVHLLQPGLGWVPWWQSKSYPAAEHYRWIADTYGVPPDTFGRYMLGGGDIVKVFVARCHARGQKPFISLRLNDGHHKEWASARKGDKIAGAAAQGLTRFYCEYPEYRIGQDLKDWRQRVQNWAIPEVRDHKFAFVRELCEGYDLDGFELDFMRNDILFRAAETTSQQRRNIVTGFIREVRELLNRTARDGQRRWLCIRVPCYLAALDLLGLDLPAVFDAGVDMINVSASYFTVQQSDLCAIRRLVPGAAVFTELCHSTWNGKRVAAGYDAFTFRRTTPEQYYTAAHLAYARGLDGVSAFNFAYYREHGSSDRGPFAEPPFHIFKRLGDPAWLARQPQHYFLAPGWKCPYVADVLLPRTVTPAQPAGFSLDLAPPAKGWQRGGRLRIQGETTLGDTKWQARLNGSNLSLTDDVSEPYPNPYPPMVGKPDEMRAWLVPAHLLRDGLNKIDLTLNNGKSARLAYLDLAVS